MPRSSRNYCFAQYNNQRFMFRIAPMSTKSNMYYIRKKLLAGKLSIPEMPPCPPNSTNTILITCGKDLQFDWV